ncbi:MAG: class B sortase [Lachnospiraceae bacterium]|nr:class B sortase [Lachnospiraceae bacterium]
MEQYKQDSEKDSAPGELAENPIDWDKLKGTDAYAWVNVPGTRIDYPVVSAPEDKEEDYYLHHSLKGRYDFAGMIYSRRANGRDFSDPVTVLYGHNMRNGSMFGTLKRFEENEFFAGHEKAYIYMPGKIYTYQIVSASQTDSRDLLGRYDYQDPDGMKAYVDKILMPESGRVRSGIHIPAGSRFLVLSTCATGSTKRRLVQAVLQNIEDTK